VLSIDNLDSLSDILNYADGHPKLTDRERSFVGDLLDKYDRQGDSMTISERQIDWLNNIANKLGIGE
jgi:hypothetical protein